MSAVPTSLPVLATGAAPFGPVCKLMIGSLIASVVELMYVSVPFTVKLPPITPLPDMFSSPPPVILPVALTKPAVVKLPPRTLPVDVTSPPVVKLPPTTLPMADNCPVTVTSV